MILQYKFIQGGKMMKCNMIRKKASKATSLILTFTMLMAMFISMPQRALAVGTTYYVDSVNGNDSNAGTSSGSAWKTLDKVNSTSFTAGDTILLAAGSSWTGQLYPKGSGEDGSPIVIDIYGTGNKPRIDGNGTVDAAMRLNNQEYWEINNLELTNNSSTAGDLRGMYVTAEDYGTANHIYVSNCYIHDVNGIVKWKSTWGWDESKRNGGIIFDVRPGTTNGAIKTNFNDIKIINNHVKDTSMIPIAVWQNDAWGWLTRSSEMDTDWYPNTNVLYRGNYVEFQNNANQACAILMYSVKNGLAEYNTVASSHTSGIETGCSDNVTFQYNEIGNVIRGAGGSDSCAIDQDEQTSNATFQYNYLHDGGVGLLVYGITFGTNFTFRYNIMKDFTKDYMQLYQQNNGGTAAIYNNVLYNSTDVSVPFTEPTGTLNGGTATLKNNIFYGLGTFMSRSNITYDYNTYYRMTTTPKDANKITSDPKFVNPGSGGTGTYSGGPAFDTLAGYQLQPSSPVINAGTSITNNGGVDFAGKTIYQGSAADMGAFEYTVAADSTILTGYVKDPYSNVIAGATVSVTVGGTTYSGTSDTSGFYSIENIPAGSGYTINATRDGYYDSSATNVTVVAGDITKQDVTMESTSTIGSISGIVSDYSGNVLSGATVTTTVNSQDYTAQTNTKGEYTIVDVPTGPANSVKASKSGYVDGQVTTTVIPGSSKTGVNISLTKLNPPVYYANDNFDNLTAGTSLASGTITDGGWKVSLGNSYSYAKVESVTGATGNALHLYKVVNSNTSTAQTGISKTGLNLTGIVTIEARMRSTETSTSTTFWSLPYVTDSSSIVKKATSLNISGGVLSSYIGGTNTATGKNLSDGNWHTIKEVLNTNSKTYSLYIDDMSTPLSGFDNVSFRDKSAININTVNFYADTTNGGNIYIDYAKINSDLPYAEEDVDLSSLSLSSGSVTRIDAFNYKGEDVPNFVDKITVTPTTDSLFANVTVNGVSVANGQPSQEISLNEGTNTIDVEVTGEDGITTQKYTISVYRVPSVDDGFLKSLEINQGTLDPSFNYGTYEYNVSVPYETNTITLQPTAGVSGAKININNVLVTSGQTSQNISLNPGNNNIDVIVSPSSGAGAYGKSYRIIVNRNSAPSAQAEVTGAKVTAEDGQFLITWTDPTDSDFDHVEISGTGITTQNVAKGVQSASITGLTNGNTYSITLTTVDSDNNKSAGVNISGKPVEKGTVLIDETFDSQTSPENFGFYYYTNVSNGVLNVTSGSPSYKASVKTFNSAIKERESLDLTFDWKTAVSDSGNKTGLEFRDDAGNLIFAICGLASEFRYSYTGTASNSTATTSVEPAWTKILAFNPSLWYTVRLQMNFATQKLCYSIVTKGDSPTTIASGTDIPISATNLNRMVACDYYGTGIQSIDNFILTGTTDEAEIVNVLQGKTIYAFGDSIVYGHAYNKSFIDYVAENEDMTVTKYAINGATIGNKSDYASRIIEQVNGANAVEPDFIVFDGLTNDAEAIFTKKEYEIGEITTGFDPQNFDTNTFAGSFENIVYQMKTKWPNAKLVYVGVHKMSSRDWDTQVELQDLANKICKKWGITVSDLFNKSEFDTRIADQKYNYTFNSLTSDGYPGTNGSGTHPNLEGVRLFFVPMVTSTLIQAVTDTTAPAEVTGANAAAGNGQITITWTDPTNSDFDHIEISGTGIETQIVNKGTQSATIMGLANSNVYNITLKTVDENCNVSTGISVSGMPTDSTTGNEVTTVTIDQNSNISVIKGESQKFTATVNGTGSFDHSVDWSIQTTGISSDTGISNEGNLTVSSDENLDSLIVRATSVTNNNIYADIAVNLLSQLSDDFTIKYNLTHTTIMDIDVDTPESTTTGASVTITTGSAVTITFAADDGYKLPNNVSVEMEENSSPSYNYDSDTGILAIADVTGDLTIEVVAEKLPTKPTNPIELTVTTVGASNIGKTSAVLKGIVNHGSEAIIGQGFEWKKTSGENYEKVTGILDNTNLEVTLTGLSKNTNYTIRAFVITESGTYYGDEKTFRTDRSSSSSSSSSNTSSDSSTNVSTNENNNATNIPYIKPAVIVNITKEEAKAIEAKLINSVSTILGEGVTAEQTKEFVASDGNKLSITPLAENGKSIGAVITAEGASLATTIPIKKDLGEVAAVYKYIPLLDKYIKLSESVVIGTDTITLQTQANATYIVSTSEISTEKVVAKGWTKVDNNWYMVNATGDLQVGWQKDNMGWTYLSTTNGVMQTDWILDGGKWYYLKNNGYMATGWVKDRETWYYCNADGSMVANTIIDGYQLGSNGAWIG
jgi:hypothetical protein